MFKNWNFGQKRWFCKKIKNFLQKLKFCSKTEILFKNWNFVQKRWFCWHKVNYGSYTIYFIRTFEDKPSINRIMIILTNLSVIFLTLSWQVTYSTHTMMTQKKHVTFRISNVFLNGKKRSEISKKSFCWTTKYNF